ncbi:MerR family DNA-binding transcriptional regulator [Actinoalloteichus sp. AHMU CJ021]|uniref:DNA-binding transcriptional regulator, MerR family n=1 Tax=Actinoalloteichus caeruleus DSM 43889 TaxID=1120930 RepID=A0ABT1JNL4_ACTCY|nr:MULTISPECIES: MerR family transcriptional regulator [Actinoalloteichus]AUS79941.1 MerR family DNA-binding transcriptional regulator [Actinoalloteichus sp. AHMU CJ021]MCP2334120.1 DNA-binding transcriptional regulator, MerR family [Actinoalloteichus caeruleus DSM 43889]
MLSISDFSQVCQLPAQTLRFYHSEGLVVPAEVDPRTGYRRYTFDQVERALLVATLRRAGLAVRLVRHALAHPEDTPELLRNHREAIRRQRQAEDAALDDARVFVDAWPQVREQATPATFALSAAVPARAAERGETHEAWYDWDELNEAVWEVVNRLASLADGLGARVSGAPWRCSAIETREQRRRYHTPEGPHWLVKVPVDLEEVPPERLPDGVTHELFETRTEMSIEMPGEDSAAKYAAALSRLMAHPLDNAFLDVARMRHILRPGGVETAMAVIALDEYEDPFCS